MALSDRFVNRNYLTPGMEQSVSLDLLIQPPEWFEGIKLKNIYGRRIKTVEELKKLHDNGNRIFIVESRLAHLKTHHRARIPLSNTDIRDIIRYCTHYKEKSIPENILEKIRSKRTGYVYPSNFLHDKEMRETFQKGIALGVSGTGVVTAGYKTYEDYQRYKRKKKNSKLGYRQ